MAFRSGPIKNNGSFPIGEDALQPRKIERQSPPPLGVPPLGLSLQAVQDMLLLALHITKEALHDVSALPRLHGIGFVSRSGRDTRNVDESRPVHELWICHRSRHGDEPSATDHDTGSGEVHSRDGVRS